MTCEPVVLAHGVKPLWSSKAWEGMSVAQLNQTSGLGCNLELPGLEAI